MISLRSKPSYNMNSMSKSNFNAEEHAILANLIDQIWQDLNCKIPRSRVYEVVMNEATAFHNGITTTYIPLLIRRWARVKLIKESKQ